MNKLKYLYLLTIPLLFIIISINGCSKLEDNITTAPTFGTHPTGWINPSNANFHGKYIASNNYDLKSCTKCHGGDYAGGNTGQSCLTCHQNTPEQCSLCHGDGDNMYPPKALNGSVSTGYLGVGSHVRHLTSDSTQRYAAQVNCDNCHKMPAGFSDTAHINPNRVIGIAQITFDDLAIHSSGDPIVPVWNRTSATCSNTYCHGNFVGGNHNDHLPVWTNPGSIVCGSCHGDPVSGNPQPLHTSDPAHPNGMTINDCYGCHGSVIDANGNIIDKTKHVNGEVNVFEKK